MVVRWSVALAVLVLALAAGPPATAGREPIQVKTRPQATLLADGAARVTVMVRCEPVGTAFESNITVTQDDGFIQAQTGLPVGPCDRRWHASSVTVRPFDGAFHAGRAYASAYVSRTLSENGDVIQGQDTRFIRVR